MDDTNGDTAPRSGEKRKSRRAFLARSAAVTGGIVQLAGCSGSSPPSTDDSIDEQDDDDLSEPSDLIREPFDSLVDLADFGIDPEGDEPIGSILEEAAADGHLLSLPSGRYRIESPPELPDISRFGLIGDDVTIVPSPSTETTLFFSNNSDATSIHLEGLAFDFTEAESFVRALDFRIPDGLVIRNVTVRGTFHSGRSPVRLDVTDSNGSGLIEGLTLPDGGASGTTVTGCLVGASSRGQLTFKDCHIEGFPDNGLYADPPAGRIVVDGGYYANSGISNIRVRGGSLVTGAHVRCDSTEREFRNMRGIRLNDYEPNPEAEPAVVEDSLIEMIDVGSSDGGITLSSDLAKAVVRDTEIRVDVDDINAIRVKPPHDDLVTLGPSPRFWCENVSIVGEADDGAAVLIVGRDECEIDDLDVTQPAANRDGIDFRRSRDNVLRNSTLSVGGEAIVLTDSTLETENLDDGNGSMS